MDKLTEGIGNVPAFDEIAGNTGDIKDSLEITHEDLKYLRDIAEQEAINPTLKDSEHQRPGDI